MQYKDIPIYFVVVIVRVVKAVAVDRHTVRTAPCACVGSVVEEGPDFVVGHLSWSRYRVVKTAEISEKSFPRERDTESLESSVGHSS